MLTDRWDAPTAPRAAHAPLDAATHPAGGVRRTALHAAALAVVLLAIVAYVDNGDSAITDEGAVIAQVGAVVDGDWGIDLPLPSVDPDGEFVTMENSDVVDGTYRPYAKHPAYPVLLLPFWHLGGHLGLLVASAVGAWAAAVVGMFLCRRIVDSDRTDLNERPVVSRRAEDLGLVTLWVLGLASPLLFGATTVMAHSIAAALTGGLVLVLVRAFDDTSRSDVYGGDANGGRWSERLLLVIAAIVLAVPLVLLRSEGLFAVAGVAAALAVCSVRSVRPPRFDLGRLGTAAALAAVGVATYLVDGRLAAAIQGDQGINNFVISRQDAGFVEGRLLALWASILRPGDPRLGPPAMVLFIATACMIAGAVLLRRSPRHAPMAVLLVVAGAVMSVVRLFLPAAQVTGLVAAFPLLVMGLVQLRRSDVSSLTARISLIASAVTASFVLATSYSIGGAAEWGGRFYQLLLPLLVPLVVIGAAGALHRLGTTDESVRDPGGTRTAHVLVAAVVVAAASLSVLNVQAGASSRRDTGGVVDSMLEVAIGSATPDDGGAPIVVTDERGLGRASWAHLDEVRILRMPEPGQLEGLLERLNDAGVGAVVLAIFPDEDLGGDVLDGWQIAEDHRAPGSAWRFVELVQDPAPGA